MRLMFNGKKINRGRLLLLVVFLAAGGGLVAWFGRANPPKGTPDKPSDKIPDDAPAPEPHFPIPPYTDSPYLNTRSGAQYIGSKACADCHRNNYQSYLRTPHSQALAELDPKAEPPDGSFVHKSSGRSYRVYRNAGKLHHEELLTTERGKEIARVDYPIRYVIGSGHFTRSYLIEVDGFLHESPVTWYAAGQKWDVSPGYDFPQHWGFERPIVTGCISCHAGRVEETGGPASRLKVHEMAIGCENCHGPGSLHQSRHLAPKTAPVGTDWTIVHPDKLSRPLQEAICARCHQSGAATVLVRGRKEGDFRPGLPLSDYLVHYRLAKSDSKMTVVGHTEQLHQSACYQKSSDLTCVTCHDPHQKESVKDKSAFYRAKCLECHTDRPCKLDERVRLKKENDSCTACHMPRGDTEIPHVAFTRHLIERPGGKSGSGGTGVPELEPVEDGSGLGALERRRNLGLAYLNVNHGGMYPQFVGPFRERAREHLEAVYRAGLREGEVAAALAEINWELENRSRANLFAREALRMPDTTAASRAFANLYVADFNRQSGDLTSAITHLETAIRLRRSADNWRLLGGCYLLQNQLPMALSALKESLAIHPYKPHTHAALAEIYRRLGDQPRAKEHLEIARWLQDHHQN